MANIRTEQAISGSIPATGRALLADITASYVWDSSSGSLDYYLGSDDDIDFDTEFRSDYETYYDVGTNADATFAYATQMVRGFDMIDSVIATDFYRVQTEAFAQIDADIVLVTSSHNSAAYPGLEGFCQFPGSSTRGTNDYWSFGTFTSDQPHMNVTPELGGGEYLNWTLIHEVGHGLGLYHPFNGSGSLPSVGAAMDNERYTVMSYTGATYANAYGHAVTMMALDIAALQQQYGTESYATGNSTYTLFDAGAAALQLNEGDWHIGRAYAAIWDSGGTDTIDYGSNGNSVLINLNAATLDRSGVASDAAPSIAALQHTGFYSNLSTSLQTENIDPDYHAGGFFSRVITESGGTYYGVDGGYSIAYGAVIENATGGSNDDLLIGNQANNVLIGGGGNDVLIGGRGNDSLQGGAGTDTAAYDVASTAIVVSAATGGLMVHSAVGSDFIAVDIEDFQFSDGTLTYAQVEALIAVSGSTGDDTMAGGATDDELRAGDGNDRLDGGDGADTLRGGDGMDTLIGGEGDDFLFGGDTDADLRDVIYGGDGNDSIDGGYGNDELRGDGGNDTIVGGFGVDTIIGGAGDDQLTGQAWSDLLFGGDGDDFINGGFGHDRVNGGNGADRFFHLGIFNHGSDWIQDYDAAEGDVLVFGNTSATRSQFQVNFTETAGAGVTGVDEAFVIYRPTGQIMWALVDGGAQSSINLQIGADVFDLLA